MMPSHRVLDSETATVTEVIHITDNASMNPASIWCLSCDAPFIRLNSTVARTNESILVCMGEVGIVLNSVLHNSVKFQFVAQDDYLDDLNDREIALVHAEDFHSDRECGSRDVLDQTTNNVVGVTCKECWTIGGTVHPIFFGNCDRSTLGMKILGNVFSSVPNSNWKECQECLGLYERQRAEGSSIEEISTRAILQTYDVLDRLTLDALRIVEKYDPTLMNSYRNFSKTQAMDTRSSVPSISRISSSVPSARRVTRQCRGTIVVVFILLLFVSTCGF